MSLTEAELRSIRDSVSLVGRLSDSIVRIGPFSLGVDGVLSWIPAVGELYSAGAGLFILAQGARAQVPARAPRSSWGCAPSATPCRLRARCSRTCSPPTNGPPT